VGLDESDIVITAGLNPLMDFFTEASDIAEEETTGTGRRVGITFPRDAGVTSA
jgi:hypothetical protein